MNLVCSVIQRQSFENIVQNCLLLKDVIKNSEHINFVCVVTSDIKQVLAMLTLFVQTQIANKKKKAFIFFENILTRANMLCHHDFKNMILEKCYTEELISKFLETNGKIQEREKSITAYEKKVHHHTRSKLTVGQKNY